MKKIQISTFLLALSGLVFYGTVLFAQAGKGAKWVQLFDGKNTNHFRGYNASGVPSEWAITDGALCFSPDSASEHKATDIITKDEYQDFDLSLEWKISKNGNSGIMYNVVENPKWDAPYLSGPEMQVLDNNGAPDAVNPKHRAGDLYDLIKSSSEPAKPAGEWNHVRIVSKNAHYVFYLNEVKINEFTMHDAAWDKLVAGSKFTEWPQFGKAKKGHICLQAHGDKVCFKNIKIKVL